MNFSTILKSACLAGILVVGGSGSSSATLLQAHTVGCTNDIFQSCSTANFLAAVGGGPLDISLDLATDKNGNIIPGSLVSGDIFSDDVTFSSQLSASFGGGDSSNVGYFAPDALRSQVSGIDFNGILVIDFTTPVSAVGFTTISLETNATIDVFDSTDTLIGTLSGISNTVLDYVGLIATDGMDISRLTIDGDFHAVRDIQFNFVNTQTGGTAVSEPAPVAILGLALLGFVALRRRRAL